MDLMNLMVRVGADTSEADKSLKAFSGGTKKIAVGVAAAFTAASAAVGKMVKDIVGAYGRYEQLVGGVDTLFGNGGKSMEEFAAGMYKMNQKGKDVKALQEELIAAGYDIGKSGADGIFGPKTKAAFEAYAKAGGKMVQEAYDNSGAAAQTVIDNAWSAFERAGMSANDYMDTVTSFSASLLQGLGGDSEKAAAYADRAIVDMSDNANKMGTDISSIQNAYQGFAKGNYTMLDNLKLGYGGTKTEMERLIKDASKMTDVQKELGIEVDSSSMSFDNIVNAISVMQKSMGIAGTTQEEAAKTIEGSLASTKAAWQNLLTAMGNGKNVKKAMSGFVRSARNVVKNVMPIVKNALSGIAEFITEIAPIIIAEIPGLVRDVLPGLIQAAGSIIKAIAQALPGLMGAVFDTLAGLDWADIGSTILGALSSLGSSIGGLFKSGWEKAKGIKWTELGSQLWEDFKSGVGDLAGNVKKWFDDARAKIREIDWVGLGTSIWTFIKTGIGTIGDKIKTLFNGGKTQAETGVDWKGLGESIIGFVEDGLNAIGSTLKQLFLSAWSDIKGIKWDGLGRSILTAVSNALGTIGDTLKGLFLSAWNAISSIKWAGIGKTILAKVKSGLNTIGNTLKGLFLQAWNAISSLRWAGIGKTILAKVKEGLNTLGETLKGLFDTARGKLGEVDWMRVGQDIKTKVASGLTFIGDKILQLFNSAAGSATDDSVWTEVGESILGLVGDGLADVARLGSSLIDGISQAVDDFDWIRFGKDIRVKLVQGFVGLGKAFAALFGASATESDTPENQSAFEQLGSSFAGAVKTGLTSLGEFVAGFFGLDTAIANISQWVEDIKQAFQPFTDWVTEIADKIASWFNLPDGIKKLLGIDEGEPETPVGSHGQPLSEPIEGMHRGGQETGDNGWGNWNFNKANEQLLMKVGVDPEELQSQIDAAVENGETTITFGEEDINIDALQGAIDSLKSEASTNVRAGIDEAASQEVDIGLNPDTNEAIRDINNSLAREHFKIKVKAEVQGGVAEGAGNHWARGMSGGRILKGATIFGMDGAGRPQIGGEAGAEAVVGVNSLGAMIRDSVRSSMGGVMGSMAAILSQMQSNNGMVMQLDSGALVGALVRDIDAGLGDLSLYRNGVRA